MVHKLTPELLLSAPRRSPGVPNAKGSQLLYTVSTHSFEEEDENDDPGKTKKELWIMDVASGGASHITSDDKAHDAHWIPGTNDQIIYLLDGEKGETKVMTARNGDLPSQHTLMKVIDAPVANLKVKLLENGNVIFVVTGLVGPDGSLFNEKTAKKKKSTGRIFDTPNVRAVSEFFYSLNSLPSLPLAL